MDISKTMNREVISFRDSIFGSPDMGVSVSKLKPIYAGRRAKVLRQIFIQENQPPRKPVSIKEPPLPPMRIGL